MKYQNIKAKMFFPCSKTYYVQESDWIILIFCFALSSLSKEKVT